MITDLAGYEGKYVIIRDVFGATFTGLAQYGGASVFRSANLKVLTIYI